MEKSTGEVAEQVRIFNRFAQNRYDSAVYKREPKKNSVTVYSVTKNLDGSTVRLIFRMLNLIKMTEDIAVKKFAYRDRQAIA